jgi:hypothetical protein
MTLAGTHVGHAQLMRAPGTERSVIGTYAHQLVGHESRGERLTCMYVVRAVELKWGKDRFAPLRTRDAKRRLEAKSV